jgi:DNA-directed RNA polymerase specialized sigma24 family protein
MTRPAALLAGDVLAAGGIADSAFAATRSSWRQLGHVSRSAELLRRRVVLEARRYRRQRAADLTAAAAGREQATASAAGPFPAAAQLVHQLPGPQLEVLVLRYYSGLSTAEIGAATGAPGWRTRRNLRQGMNALSAAMAELLSDAGALGAGQADDVFGEP